MTKFYIYGFVTLLFIVTAAVAWYLRPEEWYLPIIFLAIAGAFSGLVVREYSLRPTQQWREPLRATSGSSLRDG